MYAQLPAVCSLFKQAIIMIIILNTFSLLNIVSVFSLFVCIFLSTELFLFLKSIALCNMLIILEYIYKSNIAIYKLIKNINYM